MFPNNLMHNFKSANEKLKMATRFFTLLLFSFAFGACRYDMQDQPRYKVYKQSEFFADNRASRDPVAGTVARGQLHDDKAFYTGKIANPNANAPVQTTTDASGNTLVASFPNDIDEFPIPVTKDLVDRGQNRFEIYCIVCHGKFGNGDGMVVRRGFPKPPTYHDDRLRNAPVGHFFDVMTNGWGKMNSYAAQVSPADRWAIAAYIRTLQMAQSPEMNLKMSGQSGTTTPSTSPSPAANANKNGGVR
jgi:mono/diheme cytochrome c family protein